MRHFSFGNLLAGLFLVAFLSAGLSGLTQPVQADAGSAGDIIAAVNGLRTGYGLPALIVDPILMSTAQATADTMAASGSCSHIGNVSGRVASAGYGGGAQVWATENIACGHNLSVDTAVYQYWSDADHMLPMTDPNYVHVGAGVTVIDGYVYYVLHAAFTSGGSYSPGSSGGDTSVTSAPVATIAIIKPVETATANPDGSIIHVVQQGQTLWSIAVAYGVHVADLITQNNYGSNPLLIVGDKVIVRPANTPTATPTITNTPRPPTRTPTRTPTPRTPTPTRTATLTPTSTPKKLIDIKPPSWLNDHSLGLGLLTISSVGILAVIVGSFRKK